VSGGVPNRVDVSEAVIFQRLNTEMVLLNMSDQSYFSLDEVGAVMWDRIVTHKNLETALEDLTATFDASPERLRTDLEQLVASLLQAGLLRELPQ
jgi:hypothetical protein